MINNSNNISFKARINFVHPDELYAAVKGFKAAQVKMEQIVETSKPAFTEKIFTCTGGYARTNNGNEQVFHIYDACSKEKFENYTKALSLDPVEGGVIIGGCLHPEAPFSLAKFDKVKDCLASICKNISIFRDQGRGWQTNFMRIPEKDLFIVSTHDWRDRNLRIDSPKMLKWVFSQTRVALNDTLEIDGKIVKRKAFPEFFQSPAER